MTDKNPTKKQTKPAKGKVAPKRVAAKKTVAKAVKVKKPVQLKENANPVGRPSSYKPEYADLVRKFCLLGANDERLAQLFEVSTVTFYAWQKEFPEFLKALKEGKDIADANIASSLYHRALGYEHAEDDIRVVNGEIAITPTIKRYPPDTSAATLWLKNRQPNVWRDKVENTHTGPDGGPIQHAVKVKFV